MNTDVQGGGRGRIAFRSGVGVAIMATFLLVWVNFVQVADDINPDAVMYFWVPLVGIIGAAMARFRPVSLSRALFVTALVHALILTALIIRNPQVPSFGSPVPRGYALNALFAMLFVGSAWLFRKAARVESALEAV